MLQGNNLDAEFGQNLLPYRGKKLLVFPSCLSFVKPTNSALAQPLSSHFLLPGFTSKPQASPKRGGQGPLDSVPGNGWPAHTASAGMSSHPDPILLTGPPRYQSGTLGPKFPESTSTSQRQLSSPCPGPFLLKSPSSGTQQPQASAVTRDNEAGILNMQPWDQQVSLIWDFLERQIPSPGWVTSSSQLACLRPGDFYPRPEMRGSAGGAQQSCSPGPWRGVGWGRSDRLSSLRTSTGKEL